MAAFCYLRLSIAARSGCATLASGAERSTVHDDADAICDVAAAARSTQFRLSPQCQRALWIATRRAAR
jgi:hypothetical protein